MRRRQSAISAERVAVCALLIALGLMGLSARAWAVDEDPSPSKSPAAPEAAESDAPNTAPADPPAAREGEAEGAAEGATGQDGKSSLDARQENVSRRFKQFEKTLLQMAEYLRKTEPERADLLLRARRKSQEDRIGQQMDQIIGMLRTERLGDAVDRQGELVGHLRVMLELLQSEDRRSEIEKEKERIRQLVERLNQITARQKDVRAQTERGAEQGPLADKQHNLTDDSGKLIEKIDRQDAERNGDSTKGSKQEPKPGGDPQQGESKDPQKDDLQPGKTDDKSPPKDPREKSPRDKDKQDEKSKPGESKSGKNKSDPGEPKPSQPGDGEPQEGESGKPQESQDQQDSLERAESKKKTPGRDEIEQARKEMEQAEEKLKKLNRDGASDNQDEAIRKLQRAKEKLEEILRQLREEERELMLAALEARFQKMLAQELLVLEGTTGLDKTPKNEWTARHFGRSRELAVDQDAIAMEAAKALTLLKEEGSSIAFPEGVEQIRGDMLSVARLLEKNEVAELTQGIERDIIESLEEMIEALQKEIEKKKSDQQQQPPPTGEQGQPQDKPLVEQIAELKMLRSLQLRINRRTKRLGGMVKGEQATDADVVEQLQLLARRQSQVQEATHGLATGKNR